MSTLPGFLVHEGLLGIDKTDSPATKTAPLHYGAGPVLPLGPLKGKLVQITLGVTAVVEQQSLDLTLHGSPDGTTWPAAPLLVWPQKFYAGTSAILLDLRSTPEVAFLQARWLMIRWGRGEMKPRFQAYLFAQELSL